MAHEQMGFHLAHGIEKHTDEDQHAGAAEVLGDGKGDLHVIVKQKRNDGDDHEENCAGQSDTAHSVVEVLAGGLPGANTGDVAAILFEVIGDLQLVKLGSDPEIGEEQDHQRVDREVKPGSFLQ